MLKFTNIIVIIEFTSATVFKKRIIGYAVVNEMTTVMQNRNILKPAALYSTLKDHFASVYQTTKTWMTVLFFKDNITP